MNYTKKAARVTTILKDDMIISSSRIIQATLQTEDGKEVRVSWARELRKPRCFDSVWNKVNIGDEVKLYDSHLEEEIYFVPV